VRVKGRPKTIAKLKKEADRLCSEYVRRSHPPVCYTCEKKFGNWKELQNGHFISRYKLTTRYDLENLRPQCVGCNYFGNQTHIFALKLLEELGEEKYKELLKRGNQTLQITRKWIEGIIEDLKGRIKDLENKNS
jgi:hypothetical protein